MEGAFKGFSAKLSTSDLAQLNPLFSCEAIRACIAQKRHLLQVSTVRRLRSSPRCLHELIFLIAVTPGSSHGLARSLTSHVKHFHIPIHNETL
jgi:hypothetical protein